MALPEETIEDLETPLAAPEEKPEEVIEDLEIPLTGDSSTGAAMGVFFMAVSAAAMFLLRKKVEK